MEQPLKSVPAHGCAALLLNLTPRNKTELPILTNRSDKLSQNACLELLTRRVSEGRGPAVRHEIARSVSAGIQSMCMSPHEVRRTDINRSATYAAPEYSRPCGCVLYSKHRLIVG